MVAEQADPRRQVNLVLTSTEAEQTEPGQFRFDLPWFNHRVTSASLGTMELANTQYIIEDSWSHVRFDEGLALVTDGERTLRVLPTKTKRPRRINEDLARVFKLPLRRNRVRGASLSVPRDGSCVRIEVKVQEDHAVVAPSGASLVEGYDVGIGAVLAPSGLSLSMAERLEYVDEVTFVATYPHTRETLQAARLQEQAAYAGSVCTSAIAGPAQLARILNGVLRAYRCNGLFSCNPPHYDRVAVSDALIDGGCGMARALGMRCDKWTHESTPSPYSGRVVVAPGNYGAGALLQRLEHGFRPLRFGKDANVLFITGPDGRVVPVSLPHPVGYSLPQVEMTVNAALGTVNSKLQGVSIERDRRGHVTVKALNPNTAFTLNFDAPGSIDAAFLGFDAIAYEGASAYTAPRPLHTPAVGVHGDEPRLQYRVSAIEEQRVLTLQGTRYRAGIKNGAITGGAMPPLHAGDLVYHAEHGFVHVAEGFPKVDYAPNPEGALVPSMQVRFEELADDAAVSGVIICNPDKVFALHMTPEPRGCRIKPQILGYEPRTYEAAPCAPGTPVIGPVMINCAYTAPNILHVEQVPYVLVELTNGSSNPTTLQRTFGVHGLITPFAKVCFAPYRVERINPAEVHFPEGDSLHPFTITLRNPDGTIYNTHGAPFSISLNVTTAHA